MDFDIEKTLKDMLDAGLNVLSGEAPNIKDCIKNAFEKEKQALKDIAEARIKNEINDEQLKEQIKSEKSALEVAILTCQVKAKVAVQDAINAAIKVFEETLKKIIPI